MIFELVIFLGKNLIIKNEITQKITKFNKNGKMYPLSVYHFHKFHILGIGKLWLEIQIFLKVQAALGLLLKVV